MDGEDNTLRPWEWMYCNGLEEAGVMERRGEPAADAAISIATVYTYPFSPRDELLPIPLFGWTQPPRTATTLGRPTRATASSNPSTLALLHRHSYGRSVFSTPPPISTR